MKKSNKTFTKFIQLTLLPLFPLLLLLSLLLTISTQSYSASPEKLYQQINQRLSLMEAVAADKWHRKIPIEDLAREKVVLEKSVNKAQEKGLSPEEVTNFFLIQIELAKKIQHGFQQQWQDSKQSPDKSQPSLQEIRPQLIQLGNDILTAIAELKDHHNFPVFQQTITAPFLNPQDKGRLFQALAAISANQHSPTYTSRLDRIIQQKVIYVGTTGDYEPFSFYQNKQAKGIDVEMAKHLANSLNAELVLLPTSWPTLLDDLGTGQYDILMSGISKKLFRQQQGFFSDSYHTGGKAPIARCDEVEKFNSLEKIDQPTTELIVNPGGTNHRFVETHITKAQVRIFPDNRTIFKEIVNGKADVMITDQIEVLLQANKHPSLCAAMPNKTLSFSAKAYLMPRDLIWKEYVNVWLEQVRENGYIAALFKSI